MKIKSIVSRYAFIIKLIILLRVSFLNLSCSNADSVKVQYVEEKQIIKSITVKESLTIIEKYSSNDNFVLLDMRTPGEFINEHLEGAVNIDYYEKNFLNNLNKQDKNKIYLIYCRTANRSGKALKMMKDSGFKEVYNMLGGIVQWKIEGLPTKI